MSLVEKVKYLCKQRKTTVASLERSLDFGNGTIRKWDNAYPSADKLKRVADYFGVTVDYLLNENEDTDSIKSTLTSKDQSDIEKRMREIKKDLEKADGLMFSGEPMSEEAIESLMSAMDYIVTQTKIINKKYVPNKHRNTDN
ncbi:helix-turn-helix domain-containing protein [Niallia taxi]|uniref:helix-turn-helix domain-containing protein n=1 Tax=Niallia taxi TaxID=2499688 RepID=UPI002551BA32|nr:helix-turn-helix transcriptional regulator [Niallia taxi]MDK8641303.1 helix-turn-helix transcriptional regulator [Niallia taxi]